MKTSALETPEKLIGLLALDQAYLLADKMGLSLTEPTNEPLLKEVLSELITTLSPEVSGVILDPTFSLSLVNKKANKTGLLIRLEKVNEPDPLSLPKFTPSWGVEDTRNTYGMAKLELYYHPAEEKALEKKQLLAEIYDYCQYEKIELMVKLMIYHLPDQEMDEALFQEIQLEAVLELQRYADLLALQYPQDPLAAATLTSELDTPWILVSDGLIYDHFKKFMRISMENGASGFLAGDVLWQEIEGLRLEDKSPDLEAIKNFIETKARDRAMELMRIGGELKEA